MTKDSLTAIYAAVPEVHCKGKCQQACGPILMSTIELVRISAVTTPPRTAMNLSCSKLQAGRCSIYSLRPLICRLWGATKRLPCPWGCKPDRYLTEKESRALLARADFLNGSAAR